MKAEKLKAEKSTPKSKFGKFKENMQSKLRFYSIIASIILGIILVIFIGFSIFWFSNGYLLTSFQGGSMEPTIKSGSTVFLKNIESLERGDVVLYQAPGQQVLIHRVVAIPGDDIEFTDGLLIINGEIEKISEDNETFLTDNSLLGDLFVLPAERYLILGDNRDEAFDSRRIGIVNRDSIKKETVFPYEYKSSGNQSESE